MMYLDQGRRGMPRINVLLVIGFFLLFARPSRGISAEYIVKLKHSNLRSTLGGSEFTLGERLAPNAPLYSLRLPLVLRSQGKEELLNKLRQEPAVEYVQLDHPVKLRSAIPNDPYYDQQWQLHASGPNNPGGSNAELAWQHFGPGGEDGLAQEVAVLIVDASFDLDHQDLASNWFVNSGEIPKNGIDDDRNGYVDDVTGLDLGPGDIFNFPNDHGTHLAGIIGARGNNHLGVSGLSWQVKMIPVRLNVMFTLKTSDVIKAYSYAIAMKTRWLKTAGREGANIVATNSSFGIDRADCNSGEYPVWNDLYQQMGQVGILSTVATVNASNDVDQTGDVPSGCSSEFVVSVTNMDASGIKHSNAGYGRISIDLAAPGTNILSTTFNNSYRASTGTSQAAPLVAGTIAYLHSIAGPAMQAALKHDRYNTTLAFKHALLSSARPNESVAETVSGGTLDVFAAALQLTNEYR